ncbi:MAG: alanine racemase [Planctomycetes bacterium]|nr:alanine racemase [Planctomycetota bacterium]
MKKYRVWAEVSLQKTAENMRRIRNVIGPNVRICVVVKADAYGHGAVPIAKTVLENGAYMVAVGDSNEAIELREAGILSPVIILGALIEEEIGWLVSYDIIPTVHSLEIVKRLDEEAKRQNKKHAVHIKVDTGMSRLGASPQRAVEIAKMISASEHLVLEGISTHLSSGALQDQEFSNKQIEIFSGVVDEIQRQGIQIPFCHVANSAGIFKLPHSYFNMVRPGIAVYGLYPDKKKSEETGLAPVLALKTQITFLKGVPEGTPVGYNRTYTAKRNTWIATLPVGYNDGYPHRLSNNAEVLVRGQLAPVVGTVTMDYTTVDVGHIEGVDVGDDVVLIGRQGDNEISVMQLAERVGTIPYEITCHLGKRVKRVYVQ